MSLIIDLIILLYSAFCLLVLSIIVLLIVILVFPILITLAIGAEILRKLGDYLGG